MPKPSRHARPSAVQTLDRRLPVRLVGSALAATLIGGAAAASTWGAAADAAPAAAVVRLAAEVAPSPVAVPLAKAAPTKAPAARRTAPRRAPAARPSVRPVPKWMPTGTGMWIHEWERSQQGDARAVVARAKAAGLSTLYVQTGTSKKGWIGTPTLSQLLPATRGTGIRVVAWDFPALANPVADARRMASAARFRCTGCPRVAAVAPDVETPAEGTRLSGRAVQAYYTTLRRLLPADVAILATVPWPSEKRVNRYPYAQTAGLADAILPMAYWYNRDPGLVTATSMAYLARFGKPVMPVGQGYDGRLDAPYLAADPDPGKSVRSFLAAAKDGGAPAVSLWSWQTTGGSQWAALAGSTGLFPVQPDGPAGLRLTK